MIPWGVSRSRPGSVARLLGETAERFDDVERWEPGALLERIGSARVVLLGEASHGTAEFYRMRARITRALVERAGFDIVAVEADWPDAAWIDRYVRHVEGARPAPRPFRRFPTWMWRNHEVLDFVEWLRVHNAAAGDPDRRTGFYGLDLYSLYDSIASVLRYLDEVDPAAARIARTRYGCLTPWMGDPAGYGRAAISAGYRTCEADAVAMLADLLRGRLEYASHDGTRYLDAEQNARLIANAERYYRAMYYGSVQSWNLRDQHMFDTLERVLEFRGPESRAVVWAHNSHIGDAAATEMGSRGEHNIGHLCRRALGEDAYRVGFGTDHGTVAAAEDWDEPMRIMRVRPAHAESYERLCHDSEQPAFVLPLRIPARPDVRDELLAPRLERAIGVIYRPESELASHYFQACLPEQFDEYIWIDETSAVAPLAEVPEPGVPETWPFGV